MPSSSWFDPSGFVDGVTVLVKAHLQQIADNLKTWCGYVDASRYGLTNVGAFTLVNGEFVGTQLTVTGATWSAGTVTLTLSAPHSATAGQVVSLNSIVPSAYNNGGTPVAIGVPDNLHITYPLASNPGAYTSGGQVLVGARAAVDGDVQRKAGVIYEREGGLWNALAATSCRVRVFNSAAQSIPNAANTAITFNSETYDPLNMHSVVSNTSRLTVPTGQDGVYLFSGNVAYVGNLVGQRYAGVIVNTSGTQYFAGPIPGASLTQRVNINQIMLLNAGDYVELNAYQDSGGALNTVASETYASLIRLA